MLTTACWIANNPDASLTATLTRDINILRISVLRS
jgi:hypothetical protein